MVSSGTDVSLPRSLPAWGESELAVIIKDETKNISENQKVEDCILGYCVANDVTCDNTREEIIILLSQRVKMVSVQLVALLKPIINMKIKR